MRYYISDCHFFHDSLNTQMDCRGFADGDAMNAYMLKQWNGRVRDKDEVVILGDLSVGKPEETNALLSELRGRLFLVRGNHDLFGKNKNAKTDRFEWVRDYMEMHDNNRKVILCHYPIMFYNGQYRVKQPKTGGLEHVFPGEEMLSPGRDELDKKTWMLYGHVHDTVDERLMRQFIEATKQTVRTDKEGRPYHIPCQMINCFCMYSDYVPLTLDEWIENDRKRNEALSTESL